jgi:hypothetical protein
LALADSKEMSGDCYYLNWYSRYLPQKVLRAKIPYSPNH